MATVPKTFIELSDVVLTLLRKLKSMNTFSTAYLPYKSKVTDGIGRVLHIHNIKTLFTSPAQISQLPQTPKYVLNILCSQNSVLM